VKLRVSLVSLCAVLLVAGCGGTDNDPAAVSLVKNAFSKPIGSANVTVDFGANLEGSQQLKGPISVKLSGPYKSNGRGRLPSFDWNIAFTGGGLNFDGRLTSTGDNVFVGFQGQSYEIGKDVIARYNQALAQQAAQSPKPRSLREFGIDPSSWVKGAKDEGDATVAGVATKHVSASIDFDKLLNDLNSLIRRAGSSVAGATPPAQLNAQQRKQFTDAIKSSSLDIYVGKADGKVRRVALSLELNVKKAPPGGVKGGTLNLSVQFANVGQPVNISAPASAKPLSQLLGQLGAGGLQGGSSQKKQPSPQSIQAYSKCLDKAQTGDIAAMQRCNALLK
jgi:hypothetical protein